MIDTFLSILDPLERLDAEESERESGSETLHEHPATQLDVITATTEEEREFNELRRELPLTSGIDASANVLFRHLKRVIPAASLALFVPSRETNDLGVVACAGVGGSAIEDLRIAVGDRISGWALAHQQAVMNSNAALELGPVARTFAAPLRYALAVPILNGPNAPLGVLTCYGSDPFTNDHRRMLEGAATLFALTLSSETPTNLEKPTGAEFVGPRVH